MNGKKILLFGCGGCLTLILIAGVLIGLFAYNMTRQIQHFGEDMHAMDQTMQRLRAEHPFTPPGDGILSPERLEIYLGVRDAAGESADAKLGWLVKFADDPGSASTMTMIGNFIRLVFTMMGIQKEVVDHLELREMSLEEYSHYTVHFAAQLHRWSEQLDEEDEIGQTAREYFEPITNLNFAWETTGAKSNDLEALNKTLFLNELKRASLNPENEAWFLENLERFTRSRAMVFMDSWIVNFDESDWQHDRRFHIEDAGDLLDNVPGE